MGFAHYKSSDNGSLGVIYDDNGHAISAGSMVLVNGTHEHMIHFERGEICIHGWPDNEFIFSLESVVRDEQLDDWPDAVL